MRSNLSVLAAQKGQRERRRITLRTVAMETGLTQHTVYGIANDTLKEIPREAINTLCEYFGCDIGDLFYTEDVEA